MNEIYMNTICIFSLLKNVIVSNLSYKGYVKHDVISTHVERHGRRVRKTEKALFKKCSVFRTKWRLRVI